MSTYVTVTYSRKEYLLAFEKKTNLTPSEFKTLKNVLR